MKALFVVNPVAGKGKGLEIIKNFESVIQSKMPYTIELTRAKGEATDIVRRYTTKEDYIVFAVGGDGTVNEVLNGMVGSGSSLAIIPTGSGNDFVRSIYGRYTIEELLLDLLEGNNQKIDIIQVGERYFLNIASVGLDAEVVYNATQYKKLKFIKSSMAYVISLFKTLLGSRGTYAKVTIDGKVTCDEEILLLAVANGSFYGGGIPMVPTAKVNDALADVCLVRELRIRKIMKVLPSVFKGKHIEAKEVEIYRAQEIEIEAKNGCKVNIDGEIMNASRVKMRIIPEGIEVRMPSKVTISNYCSEDKIS
ncbi:MAG: diacylglycerol kinase family lipid kinase [Cellulosilyticum sp.]|nr:diacylglycerol kinase family lipid kinase [Cellulosilyticum sp.]